MEVKIADLEWNLGGFGWKNGPFWGNFSYKGGMLVI